MKKVINIVLGVTALAMLFICYRSIAGQEEFDAEVKQHEADVKKRLLEIKDAQEAYKGQYGQYCESFDTLIVFVETGKLPLVRKEGVLSDEQMEKGLTEEKVGQILARGNAAEIAANGLQDFVRDTTWVSLKDSLYGADYDANQMQYIPYSDANGDEPKKFELLASWIKTKSESIIPVMECGATFDTYLVGHSKMWNREVTNRTVEAEDRGEYPGLKIGEVSQQWNNNAGNWE